MSKSEKKNKLKCKNNLKATYGITLITLVITIILLIILSGVMISIGLGGDALFSTAKEARDKYLGASEKEKKELNELYQELEIEDLPENTKENPQHIGKQVALKEGWGLETVKYTSTKNAEEVKGLTKVATVYAISVGNGETVPVPKGFWYVGGTIENGVIISDNAEDRYGYNIETKKENDMSLDKTTHEYAEKLKGNQFVWIPCLAENYNKNTNWNGENQKNGTLANANWDTSTNSAENTQIEKYCGFYVGRYEAGTSNIQGIDFSSACENNTVLEYTSANGEVTSKANEIPYYHANYETAVKMSEGMYKNDNERNKYVNSGLITGTMWDVMLKTMNEKTNCNIVSSDWGNYTNYNITDARGKYTYVNAGTGNDRNSNTVWRDNTNSNNEVTTINGVQYWKLLSTGSSNKAQKMHIYDVAGNLWEWTQEMAYNKNDTEMFIIRGGPFSNQYDLRPACYRAGYNANRADINLGFRVALYIK